MEYNVYIYSLDFSEFKIMGVFGIREKGTIFIFKICKNCKLEKEHTSKGKWCVECVSEYNSWYRTNKDPKLRIRREKFYKRGRFELSYLDRRKDTQLYKKYGISLLEYNKILAEQNECCAICEKHQSLFKKKLMVDHNHITGKVRGLLCFRCNSSLGHLEESLVLLENMKKYIIKYL